METETNIPEDASATSLLLLESITKIERGEMNFSQSNGNDVSSKHPLIDESRQENSVNIGEVSEPRPQEIYQESRQACAEIEKQAEHHPEGYGIENKISRNTNSEGQVTMETTPKSSSPEDEAPSTLPTLAFAKVDVIEDVKTMLRQTLMEEESTSMDNNCRPENEHEKTTKVHEGIAQPECMDKTCTENEHSEHQSESQSPEKVTIKHINSKEMMATEQMTKTNYETKELEKIPESHSDENLKINDGGNIIMPDEAEDIKDTADVELQKSETQRVPDDKAASNLPTIASIPVETVEKNVHGEIHKETESAVEVTNEKQKPNNDFEENMKALEAFDVNEATVNTSMENEKKAQPQYQAQSQETVVIKHQNLGLDAAETIPSNDTRELKNIPVSHTREKLEIMDGGTNKHEDAKEMGEETDAQLPKTAKESESEDEAMSILLKLVVIEQGEMAEKSFEKETLEEEESIAAIDNDQSCRPQNELEQMCKALEMLKQAIDVPQTMGKDAAENERSDSQSEAPGMENVITKHTNSEENLKMESSAKPSYDEEELEKIPESHLVHNSEIKYGGKIMSVKAIDIIEANEAELRKSEAESVSGDKALSTLDPTASVSVETVEQSIKEEIHREVESAVTDTKDGQRPEKDPEEKKNVLEAFDIHEATGNISHEKEKKAEIETEVWNLETIVIKHLNLEGETIEVNTSNDTEDREKVSMPHTEEGIEIKKILKCIQEERKDMEEATEDEALPTMPTLSNAKDETVEEIFQEQNLKEEESATMNINNSNQPEYELESVTEAIYQPETMANISAENEQHAEHQSKASATEILIAEHINEEGNVAAESTTKSSYDVDEVEKIPDSHSVRNLENMDGSKISTDEATDIKEATNVEIQQSIKESVPEDKASQTLTSTSTTSVSVEAVVESIQEEIHLQEELAVANTKEGQIQEIDFGEKKEAPEIVCLHEEVAHQTNVENEQKVEVLSEALSQKNTFFRHLNLEGKTTGIINPTNDSEEQKNVPQEVKEMDGATKMQLQKNAPESVSEDKALQTLPSTTYVSEEAVEESIQERIATEAELAVTSTKEGKISEIEFEEKKKVPEASDLNEITYQTTEENEPQAELQSETQNQETTFIKHLNLEGKTTDIINPTNDSEEQENVPAVSFTIETFEVRCDRKHTLEEAKEMEEASEMQLLKTASESVPEDKALQTLPSTILVDVEALEESIQENMHTKEDLAVKNTNEEQIQQINLQEKKKVPEAFDLHKVTCGTCVKKHQKAEPESKTQNQETIFIKHQNLEGMTTNIMYPDNDNEKQENVPLSHTGEKLEFEDDEKFIQEEAKDINEATKMQLLKTASESVPDDKAPETLTITESVTVEATEESIQDEIHREAELAVKGTKEGQIPKMDFEAFGPNEVTNQTCAENKVKAEPKSEVQNQGTAFIKQPDLEGKTANLLNPPNNNEENENVLLSYAGEKIDTDDDGKFIQAEAKEMEEATEMKLQKITSESVFEDKDLQTLPCTASVNVEAVDKSIQEEIYAEAELTVTNSKAGQIQEIDFEDKKEVHEAFGLHDVTCQIRMENGLSSEHHPEEQNQAITFTKYLNLEGENTEINPNNDTEAQEKVLATQSRHKLDIEDDGKFIQKEAKEMLEETEMQLTKTATESVPEDETQSKIPILAIVNGEAEETLQQQTLQDDKTAAIDNDKTCGQENELEKKANVEAINHPKTMVKISLENEEGADHQSKASSRQTVIAKHINAEGKMTSESSTRSSYDMDEQEKIPNSHSVKNQQTNGSTIMPEEAINTKELTDVELQISEQEKVIEETDILNPINDTEEQEKVPLVHTREKLEIMDDGKLIQREAKVTEEVTKMQLLKTATESAPGDETQSTMHTLAIVKHENEEILQKQTLHGDESAAMDDKNNKQENELGETDDIVEEIDQPLTMAKVRTENDEQADHQSAASSRQSVITKDINAEVKETSESNRKSSQQIPVSHSVKNSEIKDGGKIRLEEETDNKESTDVDIQSNKKESVPEDNVQPTLPNRAFVSVEASDGSIQEEMHTEGKLAVTNTKEGQTPENSFEEKKKIPKAFDLHDVTHQISTENKQKVEPKSEVQNHETTVIMHLNLEGETTEINPTNETEEHEKIPALPTKQKLEIKDDGKFILDEAKEEAIEMQLLKTASECIPEDENHSALSTSTTVKGEKIKEFFKEQTLKEEESAAMDNSNSCRQENELEQTNNVVEPTDEPKTMGKVRSENEEHADHQSEQSTMENVITKHIISEGMVTTESSTKSSYDKEELKKLPDSDSVDKSEIKDGGKTVQDKAIDMKESTDVELQMPKIESVSEDKAISPFSTIPSVRVETVEESIQEELKNEAESAVIDTKEEQKPINDFVENTKVLEAFDLHEVTSNICSENEKKDDCLIMDTTIIKHSNIDGLETTEINPSINVEELEKVLVSHTREKLEINDGEEIKQEEARDREEATEMQSLKTTTESVHDDEAPSAIVQGEMAGQSFQEQTFKEEESASTDNKSSSSAENELQQTTQILEPIAQPETTEKVAAENDENADHKSEAPSMEKVITEQINSEEMVTTESSRKTSYDVEEMEKIPETRLVDNSKSKDAGVPEDISNIASAKDETFEKSVQEEIYKEAESSVTDTNEGQRPENEFEAESSVTDTNEGQRPENEFEENTKVLEAFDLHKETGYACTKNETKAEARYEAQSQDNKVIKHPNLEALETEEISPINDTNEIGKEYTVVRPGDVSELLSADIMWACSNEDIPMLKDQSMLSDLNTNNTTSDISKLSAYNYCKLDSEKEDKLVTVACGCTATSTPKNSETIEGQENSKTTFEDSLTGVAIERLTTELETEDSSHEQETTDGTPAEKIVKAADKNENLKLAPESIAIEKSDKKNSSDASMHTADETFTDDEKGEKVRNSLESTAADKIACEMHESTKTDKSEIPVEKIPEPPYPCKKLEAYFDSEAHNQTNEQLSQTNENSNDTLYQISESDDHIQGQKLKHENQIKPGPQIEGGHHFGTPLNSKPISAASLITEAHDKVNRAGGIENIEEQTTDSEESLSEVQVSFPREETVNQVKDHDNNNSKATDSNEQKVTTHLSFENNPTRKEATSRDSDEAIKQAATENLETQEAEITQVGTEKEEEGKDEFEKISPSSSGSTVMIKGSRDFEMKGSRKKSHGILSGVGSKVKHSISKVKKAITGKSSQPKTQSPKEIKQ